MPFCPECRSEYVAGISHCRDCGKELVSRLPEEPTGNPGEKLEKIWEAYGELDAQLVHSLLESEGIESVLQGEAVRFIHGFTLNGLGKVKILVRKQDADRARRLMEDSQDVNLCTECGMAFNRGVERCPACGAKLCAEEKDGD